MSKIFYERPKNLQNQQKSNKKVYVQKTVSINGGKKTIRMEYGSNDGCQKNGIDSGTDRYMSTQEQEQQYYQPAYEASDYTPAAPEISKNNKIKEWIANGAIVVLSIGLVISIMLLLTEVRYMNYSIAREEDSFWYNIDDGRYAGMVGDRWANEVEGVRETAGLRQCYAVADYFEAASFYKAAVTTGNIEDMQKYAAKMEEAYAELDDIAYVAEDINIKLGLDINLE